jgi:hypothetical protein
MRLLHARGRYFVMAAAVGGLVGLAASTAAAAPRMSISFQASSGNSAGWVTHNQEAYLTINSDASDSFAVIDVHHFSTTLPTLEPSYTPVGYASGTPRIFIDMSNGNFAFIYPDSVYGTGNVEYVVYDSATQGYTTSIVSYATFAGDESGVTVSAVYIVADTSQPPSYTADITCFQYSGDYLIGSGC